MNNNILPFSTPVINPSPQVGGGNGGGSGLEARVAKLESSVEHIERDVGELRTDMRDVRDRLARLEERVSHLPGKGFIVASLLVTLAVLAGLITFETQIQQIVSDVAQPQDVP